MRTRTEEDDAMMRHLEELIEPVGVPHSVSLTIDKAYPAPAEENKHVQGHHVGSWHFIAKTRGEEV
jgi:hypothetical protein